MDGPCGDKNTDLLFIVGWGSELGVEFLEQFSFFLCTFDSNDISGYFEFVAAMADSDFVDFEGGKDWNKHVTICFRFLLEGLEGRVKFNS